MSYSLSVHKSDDETFRITNETLSHTSLLLHHRLYIISHHTRCAPRSLPSRLQHPKQLIIPLCTRRCRRLVQIALLQEIIRIRKDSSSSSTVVVISPCFIRLPASQEMSLVLLRASACAPTDPRVLLDVCPPGAARCEFATVVCTVCTSATCCIMSHETITAGGESNGNATRRGLWGRAKVSGAHPPIRKSHRRSHLCTAPQPPSIA